MPRLTYCPSRSSRASRVASCVRVSAMSLRSCARARGNAFDPFAFGADLDDALYEDARQLHVFRNDLPRFHQPLDLGYRNPPGHRTQRIEVARRFVEKQISV